MDFRTNPALRSLVAPVAILAAVALALWAGPALPPSLAGLKQAGAYFVLLAAAGMSLWFNRGRAFVAAASLLFAYFGYRMALELGADSFAARAVYTAAALLVPLNALISLALPERGVSYHGDYRWLFIFAGELLLVLWIAASGRSPLSGAAWQEALGHWLLRSPPTPLAARLAFGAAVAVGVARAWPTFSPLEVGVPAALGAFFIACEFAGEPGAPPPGTYYLFIAAAGAMLLTAVLHESHRMAFRDALTGLPNRRALEEQLRALGDAYTIAMVDVDHFKAFNDTHGHDTGDQVLKLVASRLAEVGGGGHAFRYGGEEFTVLFPGHFLFDCMPHLEKLRASVEGYRMALRGEDRPQDKEEGAKRRAGARAPQTVSVTVSIGASSPSKKAGQPSEVLKLADEALYRAKKGGRNRVSR